MRFELVRWPRPGSPGVVSLGVGSELIDGADDRIDDVAHEQQYAGQDALYQPGRVAPVASALALRQPGGVGGHYCHQRAQVVGQHLGGYINDLRLLAQARDRFEVQEVLQALERLLAAPALVIQLAEGGGICLIGAQVGGQHTDGVAGGDVAH